MIGGTNAHAHARIEFNAELVLQWCEGSTRDLRIDARCPLPRNGVTQVRIDDLLNLGDDARIVEWRIVDERHSASHDASVGSRYVHGALTPCRSQVNGEGREHEENHNEEREHDQDRAILAPRLHGPGPPARPMATLLSAHEHPTSPSLPDQLSISCSNRISTTDLMTIPLLKDGMIPVSEA